MKHTDETKAKMKAAWIERRKTFVPPFKDKKMSEETRNKMSKSAKLRGSNRTGKKHTEATKKKISEITRERTARGEHHYAFSYGRKQRNMDGRRKVEYFLWRKEIFVRDNFTCQKCGDDKGGNLRAHHIKPYSTHPELRYEVTNGITLCHPCHELEHFKADSIRNIRKLKRGEKLWK